jgi:hypothetical protein
VERRKTIDYRCLLHPEAHSSTIALMFTHRIQSLALSRYYSSVHRQITAVRIDTNILQLNLPKTERESFRYFSSVSTGFRFTKGCVLIKTKYKKKYDRLGLQ